MMKDIRLKKYGILLLGIGCFLLSGCGKQTRTIADVQKNGTLKVGVGVNTEYSEKQRYLSPEEQKLVDSLCEKLSVAAEYTFCQPRELELALAGGDADLAIGGLRKSEWKERQDIWCSEVYEQNFLFSVTRRGDYISSVKALSGQNVGVSEQIGEIELQQLYLADDITLVPYKTADKAEQDLKTNVISAYVCFQKQAEGLAEDSGLQIQDLTNTTPEARVILVKAGSDELAAQINSLIQEKKLE